MTLQRIRQLMRQHTIRHVKLGGFDVDGVLRGKYVALEKFESAAEGGLGFCDVIFGWDSSDVLYDNVSVTGWHTGYPDGLARIDLDTFRILPWEPNTAFFLLDFFRADGKPFEISPRQLLKNVVARAASAGYQTKVAVEFEYFFFKETPLTVREKNYRNLIPLSPGMFGYSVLRASVLSDLAHDILETAKAMDIELEGHHTETGPGVYETAIRNDTALHAADKAALFKTLVKVVAQRRGLMATFMAKWNQDLPGCSGHVHQSLSSSRGQKNLFHSEGRDGPMSALMKHYMAGQLALMPEFMVMYCPTVNSFRRTVPGTWAPTNVTWGMDNRTTALRAITLTPKSTRVEVRLPGADANPYLSVAACLASGLYGIENRSQLSPATSNAYQTDAPPLPASLGEAARLFQSSAAARNYFGKDFVEHYAATREWEFRQYLKAVTDWELNRYFEVI
jgi:glutamine synthetase